MTDAKRPEGLGALAQAVILRLVERETQEALLKAAKAKFAEAQEAFKDAVVKAGLDSVKYHGFTVFLQGVIHASLKGDSPDACEDENAEGPTNPKQKAIDALKANGLDWMVKETVHQQTLTAWVKEQPTDARTMAPVLPEPLKPFISVFQDTEVRVHKS